MENLSQLVVVLTHTLLTYPALIIAVVVLGVVVFQAVRLLRQKDAGIHHETEHHVPNYDQDA
jgi:hypothetical protein